MKKLLGALAALGMTATTAATVVACGTPKTEDVKIVDLTTEGLDEAKIRDSIHEALGLKDEEHLTLLSVDLTEDQQKTIKVGEKVESGVISALPQYHYNDLLTLSTGSIIKAIVHTGDSMENPPVSAELTIVKFASFEVKTNNLIGVTLDDNKVGHNDEGEVIVGKSIYSQMKTALSITEDGAFTFLPLNHKLIPEVGQILDRDKTLALWGADDRIQWDNLDGPAVAIYHNSVPDANGNDNFKITHVIKINVNYIKIA